MMPDGPVPGRECGACDVCCVVFKIEEPSIAKEAGVRCRHLTSHGCAIYEARPDTCRKWLCGWRLIEGLPEHWRPDLSGILIYQMKCTEPSYGETAFIIALSRGMAHMTDMAVLGFVQNMVKARVPLYLTLHAGKADGRAAFLNSILEPAVALQDGAAFITVLSKVIRDGQNAG
jgi:hypothetical protein